MKSNLSVFFILFPFILLGQHTDHDLLPASFFKDNRTHFIEEMPPHAIAVFFSNPIRNRNNDVDFQFSQNPNFYYLSGFRDPDAVLILFKDEKTFDNHHHVQELLFIRPKNRSEEIWTGFRPTCQEASAITGIEAVYTTSEFKEFGIDFSKIKEVWADLPTQPNSESFSKIALKNLVEDFREKVPAATFIDQNRPIKVMASFREVKQKEEIKLIQKAIDISIKGFIELMKAIQPGFKEYQAQAIEEYFVKFNGGEYQGYPSICGGAGNSCILHYQENRDSLKSGDLLLADMGGEYHGYTADITRTFPVNGRFSEEQKAVYELVLKAQEAGIAVCLPGKPFRATHEATMTVVAKGLMELGIIKEKEDAKNYFMHGTSHYLGLDVHDAGTYGTLKPGTIITVEPGIYIPEGSPCDKKWWNIGVRIEDDILVNEQGTATNLSGNLPRTVSEIESLMQEKSKLKQDKE
ncbi:MAG: aminopeptidase P N-terminal domain-containing protein [Bacteroidota bacterium]